MNSNLLIDTLPESLNIDGFDYPIDTDYTTFILVEELLEDRTLNGTEKSFELWELLFTEEKPEMNEDAVKQIEWFYRCGKVESQKRKEAIVKRTQSRRSLVEQIYDFECDDQYIFSAFMQCYGIDLTEVSMHWWKFKALFNSLSSDCEFVKIMGYRSADVSKIKDKEEKQRITRLQALYALPSKLTAEEKAERIGSMF